MAIDRISSGNPAPLITQRLDVSPATPMVPGVVQPLVPIGPYMAPAPDAGTLPAQLQQGQDGLASLIKPNADGAGGAMPRDSSAMQVNQLFFTRQLIWQPPDAAQLAASWRVMVKTYGEQYAALQEQARGQHVPGNLFMAEQQPALLREGPRPPLTVDSEAWRFAVYGWAGQRLLLRVLASDEDEDAAPKRRGKVALRVEVIIIGIGRVVIQMEPAGDGVLLELAADEDGALHHLRQALPEIADAVRRAGLRLVRCRLNRQLHAQRVHGNYPMQAAAATLSLPLFRAMAEVALLLTQPPAEAAANPDEPAAPPAAAEEEPVIVSKEVAAPFGYDYGDGEGAAQGSTVLLLADGQEHDLLPPIDEQD
ncbi:hypothetical protein [Janthinobacterium violaceinigrum]|uniref:Flagellar hook-length control protein FliK n=1 Tax=Janthinobacterium violaceinigrum TaxID=2654252 RepID=A0A6I1I267_9BURK|nr:hypothetical protein [Janthinobacterium violaceinigrum]KAB8064010.1 hypothetical protein GCN75_15000 [Janthinobacterium violaceinigrum]